MGFLRASARACAHLSLALAFAASTFAVAPAQTQTIDVTGTVTSADDSPIAGASVALEAHNREHRATTDASGAFLFKSLPAGTYTLYAAAPGYQRISERTVTVDAANPTIGIVLDRATTNSLTVIGTVRSSASETVSTSSAPTVTINAQDAAAAAVTSVGPMVWPQLSVTPVLPLGGGSNATQTFSVRGPDPTETLVDIDGHYVNNGNTGDFDLSLIDPAALQDVQIVYGISPSSLIGPNTIGGGINIVTLQPTATPHGLVRLFGGSYGSYGGTVQATGTADGLGYAFSLHGTSSLGSVNQSVLAPSVNPPSDDLTEQNVGSGANGDSILTKLRYQLGGPNGYGYLQFNFRNQNVTKDESALLTTYTPPGFSGSGGDDARSRGLLPQDDDEPTSPYQSFAGTFLQAHNANYGFDAQVPLGKQMEDGAPATVALFSHMTTLSSQSVAGPGEATLPYLYNQRDLLGDDWLEIDHHFPNGTLSFKYDLATESLGTNYVQGQVTAEARGGVGLPNPAGFPATGGFPAPGVVLQPNAAEPPVQTISISQVQRYGVLRYSGEPSAQLHFSLATYFSNDSSFGTSFDPRAGIVWTPTGNTAVRASVGTTFQTPQLSELVVPPPADRVPIGGIIFVGNPNLQPDHATDYDLGAEQIFGSRRHPFKISGDLYQSNLRAPANQLVVEPEPHCQTKRNPDPCPLSYPVNAGNGTYRGIELSGDYLLSSFAHLRAGWSVDSSYLTAVPENIQDGTLVIGEQTLGQPLHKAYFAFEQSPPAGLAYGARLNWEGFYNELNRSPYATLDAHVSYRYNGYDFGLFGTNLTNVYANPFTIVGGGVPYGAQPGEPMITPNAYVLQGAAVTFVLTRAI